MANPHDSPATPAFRLQMLGGLAVVAAMGSAAGQQRRRLALLAILASARDRGMTRDRIASLLSPESSTESARHSLHQLLYYLRQQLGEDAFLGTDPLRLNPAVIASDVSEFELALERDELACAAAIYRGPFLDGFHLNVTAFEEWVASERQRLATMHSEAVRRLANESEEAGNHAAAIAWWRQLATLDPLSGSAALGLMRTLAAAGDASAALRHARVHSALLQTELGTRPDATVEALVARLQARTREMPLGEETSIGAFRLSTAEQAAPAGDATKPRSIPLATPRHGFRRSPQLRTGVGLGLVLALAAVVALRLPDYWRLRNGRSSVGALRTDIPVRRVQRLALLPLRSTANDSSARVIAEGLTREMIWSLTRAGVTVIGHESVAEYTTPGAPLGEIARVLRVDAIGTATFVRRGGSVEIALEVANPRSGENLWVNSTTVDSAAISRLASDAAQSLAGWILGNDVVFSRKRLMAAAPVTSSQAYTSYLLGMREAYRATAAGMKRGLDLLEQSIVYDSSFALAHAGLGFALTMAVDYAMLPADEAFRRADPIIGRALALDSNLALAHLAKARLLQLRDWNWRGAELEYRKAIDLEPNARSYQVYGWFLEWYVGRAEEGVAMGERAVQLEPSSASVRQAFAWRLRGANQLERALTEAGIGLALDSTVIDGHWILAEVHLRRGDLAEAERSARRYVDAGGDVPANSTTLGEILARSGRIAEASAYAARLALLARRDGPSLVALARTEMSLGHHDRALSLLEQAVREHVFTIPFQPYWDPIRSDRRFRAVMRTQGVGD